MGRPTTLEQFVLDNKSKVLGELCKNCRAERRRNGSAYGEKCSRRHKGLPVPDPLPKAPTPDNKRIK